MVALTIVVAMMEAIPEAITAEAVMMMTQSEAANHSTGRQKQISSSSFYEPYSDCTRHCWDGSSPH
jgi:hypothetical protein